MFTFGIYSSLLLVGCTQGLVYAVLLLLRARREERLSDVLGALILLVGTLYAAQWMLGFAGWYDERDWRTTIMFYTEWSHLLALGPLVWLYFQSVTNTDFQWQRRYWWHFAPALLFWAPPLLATAYDFSVHAGLRGLPFTCFGESRGPAMDWIHTNLDVISDVEDVAWRIHMPIYLVLSIRLYRRFRTYVRDEFSNADELDLSGLRNLLYVLLAGVAAAFVSDLVAEVHGIENYADVWLRYFFVSAMVFGAAILLYSFDLRHTGSLRFRKTSSTSPVLIPQSEAPDESIAPWIEALEARLDEHSDYLESDLKLADLAARIGTNASVLSRTINSHYSINFNDYINGLRCANFVKRVRAGEHMHHTLLSLALDSGFNSKSTFNRAFLKRYGYPPSQAADRLGANDDLGRPT